MEHKNGKNKLIVILGPTASGKTDLAIKLARQFNGEIVCADSRQIYKEMAIGTASPFQSKILNLKSKNHFRGIPHHLFHIVSPKKNFSVAQYQKLAVKTIKDIQKRGKRPFLVGGSPFYVYAVAEGWAFPKIKIDAKLRGRLEKKSVSQLLATLRKLSPERAKTIEAKNKRRLIRAIEIAKGLGQVAPLAKKPLFDCLFIGLKKNPADLEKRISQRTENMFKAGLEKEARNLRANFGEAVLSQTIGYQELLPYLDGQITKTEALEKIKLRTRQFVRRQLTWFKRDQRIQWIRDYKTTKNLIQRFL